MATLSTPQDRNPALDGLRGIAILLVAGFHLIGSPLTHNGHDSIVIRIFTLGWCGVDLFFVLSGYLIGGILLDHIDSPSYYRTFYARRAFRILPPYLFLVCAAVPLLRVFRLPHTSWFIYAFMANFAYSFGSGWVGMMHLWSLSAEEQFYALLPPVIRGNPRFIPPLVLAIFAFSPLIRLWEFRSLGFSAARFLPFGHMDGLMMGVLIAYLIRRHRPRLAAIAPRLSIAIAIFIAIAACFVFLGWTDTQIEVAVFGYTLFILLFSCVLTSILMTPGKWTWLSDPALRYFGRRSYTLYLVHFPVFWAIAPRAPYILSVPVSIILAIAIAEMSWRWIEEPILQRGRRVQYAPAPVALVADKCPT